MKRSCEPYGTLAICTFAKWVFVQILPDDHQTDTIASNLYRSDVSIILYMNSKHTEKNTAAGGQSTEFDWEENVFINSRRSPFGMPVALGHTWPNLALAALASQTLDLLYSVSAWNFFVVKWTKSTPPIGGSNKQRPSLTFLGHYSQDRIQMQIISEVFFEIVKRWVATRKVHPHLELLRIQAIKHLDSSGTCVDDDDDGSGGLNSNFAYWTADDTSHSSYQFTVNSA